MGKSLSLEAIKQQFNLSQNATVAEVKQIAEANNIVIDFSKNENNAKQLNNNSSGGILGGNTSDISSNNFGTKLNNSFSNTSLFDTSASTSMANENSVFGFGSTNTDLSNGLSFNKTSFEIQTLSNLNGSGMTKGLKDSKDDVMNLKLEAPKMDFASSIKANVFSNFLNTSMSSYDRTNKISFIDDDSANVVKLEYSEDGTQVTKTLADGTQKVELLTEEQQALRAKQGMKVISTEYADGKAKMTLANGQVIERDAVYGERGFVKDGNSIDEDLVATLGKDRLAELQTKEATAKQNIETINVSLEKLTDENIAEIEKINPSRAKELKKEKANLEKDKKKIEQKLNKEKEALAAEYIKKVYKECGGDKEKIKARIGSLVKNSDMNTAASQQMVHILGGFYEKYGNMSEDEMASVLAGVMDPSRANGAENAIAMAETSTRMKGKQGQAVRGALVGAAQQTGNEKIVAESMTQNIGNTVDAETGEVDVESAQDIGRKVIDLTGKEGAHGLAEQLQKEDNDDLKVAANKPIDEYAAQTGDKDVIQDSLDVISSIEDADKQVQANENAHATYEEMGASDEIKQFRAELMAQNLDNFNQDAISRIDEFERQNDINNTYSKTVTETKSNKTETKKDSAKVSDSSSKTEDVKVTTSQTTSASVKSDSSTVINKIVSSMSLNTIEKAKQVKALAPKEQQVAVEKLLNSATLPEIKGLILSGLKSEVFSYMLDNFSAENRSTLDSLKYLMTPKDLAKYEKLLQRDEETAKILGNDKKANADAIQIKKNFFSI